MKAGVACKPEWPIRTSAEARNQHTEGLCARALVGGRKQGAGGWKLGRRG